jgi:acetyltransferase-like isoleucine patch superfamily enzyme
MKSNIVGKFINNMLKALQLMCYGIRARNKAPKMIFGYLDSNGELRCQTRVSDATYFYHQEKISIANNVFIWHFTVLDGTGGIEIGEGTQIGANVGIFTHSSHMAIRLFGKNYLDIPEKEKKGFLIAPVKIGKYVFIASGAKILHGVTIGDGSIIAVNTVVKEDVPPYSVVSGNPAEIIGNTRIYDKAFLKAYPELQKYYYDQELLKNS